MNYTHVLLKMKAEGKAKPLTYSEADLSEHFVVEHIIKPFVNGSLVIVDGSRALPENIEKITVFSSELPAQELIEAENDRNKSSTARERANRIFSGNVGPATLATAVMGQNATNITRRIFNQALGITEEAKATEA